MRTSSRRISIPLRRKPLFDTFRFILAIAPAILSPTRESLQTKLGLLENLYGACRLNKGVASNLR
jgi:hypothetical protein